MGTFCGAISMTAIFDLSSIDVSILTVLGKDTKNIGSISSSFHAVVKIDFRITALTNNILGSSLTRESLFFIKRSRSLSTSDLNDFFVL